MDIAPYLKDASHFQGTAERILFPSDEKEIVDILKEAHQTKTPVTVSGAGTGLTGARVPQGGLVLSLEKMNRILDIHWDKQKMRGYTIVEPGVRLEELEEVLTAQNLFYPPNPGEKKAFLGGTVATNASGSRHLKYGATRSYVQRLRVVLAGGETLAIGRGDTKAHGRTLSVTCGNNREIRIPLPTYRMPNTKNSAGY